MSRYDRTYDDLLAGVSGNLKLAQERIATPLHTCTQASRIGVATIRLLRRTFELAGIEFVDENGGGPGVRLRKRQRAKRPK